MTTPPQYKWKTMAIIAEEDREAFLVLVNSDVALAAACFYAQQSVEKYLKAVLSKENIPFPFTHDLIKLYYLFQDHHITFPFSMEMLEKLNPFAVKQRYDRTPILHTTRDEVKSIVNTIADWCKEQLHD